MGTVFENPVEYEAGENPTSIVSGDWDQNGRIDLMVLNPRKQSGSTTVDDGTLTLFLDNASDSGKFPFTYKSLAPYTSVWRQHLAVFDFNADNQTDLVVAAANLDQISLLQNDSGSFSENASISVGDVPVHLETGDWDADNDIDLAVVNRADNSFSILKNSSGIFTLDKTYNVGEGAIPLRIIGGDWDNDGETDLAILASGERKIQVWLNNGGNFTEASSQPGNTGNSPKEMIGGDWNCDGRQDLATANYADNTLSLYYGRAETPYFSDPVTVSTGWGPLVLDSADFNSDNLTDFIVAHRFSFSTTNISRLTGDWGLILSKPSKQSDGSVSYENVELFASTLEKDGSPPADVLILDIDNDTRLDLLLSLPVHKKIAVLSGKAHTGTQSCS